MSRMRLLGAGLAVCLLSACGGAFEPYSTVALPLDSHQPAPAGQRIGICYNTLTASLAEVQKAAQQACPAETVAEPTDTDYHLQGCPLLIPGRATFVCTPKK